MGRTTKQLSGGGKDKFLRGLLATEPAIAADTVQRLGDTLCDAIADVRVRRDAWHPTAKRGELAGARPSATAEPVEGVAAPTFDPFSFSALAVLTRQGAAALAAKLDGIVSADELHALATAQHLAVNAALVDVVALRAALVRATENRLAERRAAAS